MCAVRSSFAEAVVTATAMVTAAPGAPAEAGTTAAVRAPTAIPMVTAAVSAQTHKGKGKDRVRASPALRTDNGLAADAGGVATSHPDLRRTNRS